MFIVILGYDIISSNHVLDAESVWRNLFLELFKPSQALNECLNCCSLDSSGYVAVHLRFVNALENFEKDQFNSLTEDKRENLIQRCLNRAVLRFHLRFLPTADSADTT